MNDKEIILSKMAEVMSRDGFLIKNNSHFKSRLKCVGLNEYFEKNFLFLTPYEHYQKFENSNQQYDVFLGLDNIFTELYQNNKNTEIISLLKELIKSFNSYFISDELPSDFEELARLYKLLGLSLKIKKEKITVSVCMQSDNLRISELFSVESWLKINHEEVYDTYKSALDSYTSGNSGACIESCRTCIVSIFSKFKGTEGFAKWIRGTFNTSGENENANLDELSNALNSDLSSNDLAEFFNENKDGKLTKTKTIYMIYCMMSDYGTHRNESGNNSAPEKPNLEDALFSLRLTDSILYWVYSKVADRGAVG